MWNRFQPCGTLSLTEGDRFQQSRFTLCSKWISSFVYLSSICFVLCFVLCFNLYIPKVLRQYIVDFNQRCHFKASRFSCINWSYDNWTKAKALEEVAKTWKKIKLCSSIENPNWGENRFTHSNWSTNAQPLKSS